MNWRESVPKTQEEFDSIMDDIMRRLDHVAPPLAGNPAYPSGRKTAWPYLIASQILLAAVSSMTLLSIFLIYGRPTAIPWFLAGFVCGGFAVWSVYQARR